MSHLFGVCSQPHVWSQGGRKVTAYAGFTERRYGYYGAYWIDPQRQRQRDVEAQRQSWRRFPRPTVAKSANWSESLATASGFFRLLDVHGKAYGRRYERVGPSECGVFLVVDQHGNEDWLDGALRVRMVTQQREDLQSQASRIINRMHREACREG